MVNDESNIFISVLSLKLFLLRRKIYKSWTIGSIRPRRDLTVGRSRDPAVLWTPARLFLKPEIFGLSLTRERNL